MSKSSTVKLRDPKTFAVRFSPRCVVTAHYVVQLSETRTVRCVRVRCVDEKCIPHTLHFSEAEFERLFEKSDA